MPSAARTSAAVRAARALSDPARFRLLRAAAEREEVSCQERRVHRGALAAHGETLAAAFGVPAPGRRRRPGRRR